MTPLRKRAPGGGRKPKDGVLVVGRHNVTLDEPTVHDARQLAQGDLSAGLRKAVRMAIKQTEDGLLPDTHANVA